MQVLPEDGFTSDLINFFGAALQCVPFMLLAVFAYLASRESLFKFAAVGWLAILMLGFACVALSMGFAGKMDFVPMLTNPSTPPQFHSDPSRMFAMIGIAIALAFVLAGASYLRPVRALAATVLPMEADSFVHATALAVVLAVGVLCVAPLIALGAPPLLLMLRNLPDAGGAASGVESGVMSRSMVYSLIWIIPCTVFAVGFGLKRNWQQALQRLGVVAPTLRHIGLGIAFALALVMMVSVLGQGLDAIWTRMGWSKTDAEAFSKVIGFAFNPLGALLVGISAGVGEELAVRGVLQPRMGILLSNAFFTALHALQYNWDALAIVFCIGLVLGLLRQRTNTVTSAIAHGMYDFTLLMLSWAQVPGFDK